MIVLYRGQNPFKNKKTLHDILNNIHKDISFKLQFSHSLKLKEEQIETDIFHKETDSKQYLFFYSCYPRHTKFNIPYNLARRIKTMVSGEHVLKCRMQELKSF